MSELCKDCPFWIDIGGSICALADNTHVLGYNGLPNEPGGWEGAVCRTRKIFVVMRDEIRRLKKIEQAQIEREKNWQALKKELNKREGMGYRKLFVNVNERDYE